MNREGFITYNHGGALFSTKTVGIYSSENPVTKIYDDIYYDPRNGNVVVVYTKDKYTNAASVDADGKNIKAIEIVPRKNVANNQIVKYENNTVDKTAIENGATVSKAEAINQVTPESRKTTLDTTEVAWSYKSGSNQVNYFTWGSNTYIYVMDITGISTGGNSFASDAQGNSFASRGNSFSGAVKHASGAFYTGSINPNTSFDFTGTDGDSNTDIYVTNAYPQQTNDGYDDKSMIEPVYHPSRTVYQITNTIKYDIANGNLLIITPTTTPKTIDVYFRSGEDTREDDSSPNVTLTNVADAQASSAPYILQSFSKSVSKPFFVQDHANKNTVMYWPTGENTLIAVFENRDAAGTIPIKKTVRFTSSGVWTAPSTSSSPATPSDTSGNRPDISGGQYGDFWKWWSYFNSNAVGGLSNDYMLKTQIVPPVCPSCPACQGGACTNCGGQGGSGSMAQDGSSLAIKGAPDGVKGPSSAAASIGQSAGQTITNTAAIAGLTTVGTGAIAADLAGKTIGTAGNIVGKTVDTAGNIVNRTFDAAGNIVDRTFDTAGNVVNTTGNLLYSAGSGVSNLLSSDPTRVGYNQSYRGPRAGSNNTGIYQPMGTQPMGTQPMGAQPMGAQQAGSKIDPYTYNGALQSKGSNYRPITTDFSSFGR